MQIPVELRDSLQSPDSAGGSAAPALSVLDLRLFSAESLRPLLETESRAWHEQLDWDYSASSRLLLQYLEARVLPGFVALDNGRLVGYTFCVYEDRKAVIGAVFALSDAAASRTEIEQLLLQHLFALLKNSPGVERIESQLLLHTHDVHEQLFREAGFGVHRRTFMERALTAGEGSPVEGREEAARRLASLGYELRPWAESDFQSAGSLIAQAYEGHIDATINDQYCSVAGSLRFLHNIIRFPGCGAFDSAASLVLAARGSGALAGLVLCSRVRHDVQHVTQLCVAGRARGSGLGSLLLDSVAEALAGRGFRSLSLTVTDGNHRAAALYRRQGFLDRHTFNAMVWTDAVRIAKRPEIRTVGRPARSAPASGAPGTSASRHR